MKNPSKFVEQGTLGLSFARYTPTSPTLSSAMFDPEGDVAQKGPGICQMLAHTVRAGGGRRRRHYKD